MEVARRVRLQPSHQKKALTGEIKGFIGIDDPYEEEEEEIKKRLADLGYI